MTDIQNNTTETCPLCGQISHFKARRKGYQEPDVFSIFHCPHCNTGFSMPRTNTDQIYNLIYKNADTTPSYSRYSVYKKEIKSKRKPLEYLAAKESSYWSIFYALTHTLQAKPSARILEVGSGLGYFTYSLQQYGFINTTGIDISSEAVNKAQATFGDYYICGDIYQYAAQNKNQYDIIILTEVIEHIEEPVSFIQALTSLLTDTGTILLTTPNKSGFSSDIPWCTDKPPVHCWWFSEESFLYIAKKLSLKASFIDFSVYFKKHPKSLYLLTSSEGAHIFDKQGELIRQKTNTSGGILPKWVKKTNLYLTVSRYLYPKLSKKYIAVGGKRGDTLCAILRKNPG